MRYALGAICLTAFCLASAAEANNNFTVVLHARTPSGSGTCTVADLPDCLPAGVQPTTQVSPGEFRLYIFINNYTDLFAMQTAFAWPGDWTADPDGEAPITFGCRGATQAYAHEPQNPGGPFDGTLATAFDCFAGPGLAAIGRVDFLAGASGCLTQVNPLQGTGLVEALDCLNRSVTIDANTPQGQQRLGSICVGAPGVNACVGVPVEPATWGKIKSSYR
jgi:hypothetical protein